MSEAPMVSSQDPLDEDESILERIGDAVEVVLSDDVGPVAEDPWERRQRLLDSWTAIVLAVAAVATAWASFQASQWSESQSDAQAAAAIARTDASRSASAATTDQIVDIQTWLVWVDAVRNGDTDKREFLETRFSEPLSLAQDAWLAGTEEDENGVPVPIPDGTPMDLPVYIVPAQVQSDADAAHAEALLAEAAEAGATATNFVLLAVILALVLFFASIATKFSHPRAQVLLGVVAVVILAVGLVRLATLPHLL